MSLKLYTKNWEPRLLLDVEACEVVAEVDGKDEAMKWLSENNIELSDLKFYNRKAEKWETATLEKLSEIFKKKKKER